ncbi:MAG: hypothetical protein R2879_00745 [Saprospiraceae bacterium]
MTPFFFELSGATSGNGEDDEVETFKAGSTTVTYYAVDEMKQRHLLIYCTSSNYNRFMIECPNDTMVFNQLDSCSAIVDSLELKLTNNPAAVAVISLHFRRCNDRYFCNEWFESIGWSTL